MALAEPMTMLTDYALALVTGYLAWRLWRDNGGQTVRRLWAFGFGALAMAAFVGGTHHGFAPHFGAALSGATWKLTVYCVGVFNAAMPAGSLFALTRGALRTRLVVVVALQLAVYAIVMATHDEFEYVIAGSGLAMALMVALHGWSAASRRDSASLLVLAAVAVSALAALVQYSRFAPDGPFNHNDLYHLVQIAAMTLFYKAGKLLRDSPPD
jgi:hypothetical protein